MSGGVHSYLFVSVLGLAYLFGHLFSVQPATTALPILRRLQRTTAPAVYNLTVALGYNVCLDGIVRWEDVIAKRAATSPGDRLVLTSDADVSAAFSHYFAAGAAAERTCDPAVFQQLVDRAKASASWQTRLGGNAAIMAKSMASVHPLVRVVLGGHIGPLAHELLPASVVRATRIEDHDEVHLILEYAKGDELTADVAAPRANRFIVTADQANTHASAMLSVIEAADAYGADVLVVAGLHMLEPLPVDQRTASIQSIAAALASRRTANSVHIELASSVDASYMRVIAEYLFPFAHSLGFNEQEAVFLYEVLGGTFSDDVAASNVSRAEVQRAAPVPNKVAVMLRYILNAAPHVSRLHYHSLGYHMAAYQLANSTHLWHATPAAVAAGAVAGVEAACSQPAAELTAEHLTLAGSLTVPVWDPHNATSAAAVMNVSLSSEYAATSWEWVSASTAAVHKFTLVPVPVCIQPASTVGLGDVISSAGLLRDAVPLGQQDAHVNPPWEKTWPIVGVAKSIVAWVKQRVTTALRRA